MLIAAALSASIAACAADPFAGTWRLNVRKSKYIPGTCPRSMTIEMEVAGNGVRYASETTQADGRMTRARYTASYDGTEAIVMATAGLMAPVSLRRIDDRTVVASYMRGMQVIATSRQSVSKNGRLMTIVTVSPDQSGRSVTNIGVYERLPRPE